MAGECAFCRICDGTDQAATVYGDGSCVAFLDTRPLFHGHCLVVPRRHFETLPDLPPGLIEPLFRVVRLLSAAVPAAMEEPGSFIAINNRVSQSVPHLHVHVVPRRPKDGLKGFFWPRTTYPDDAAAQATARAIREAIASMEDAGDD